MQYDILMSSITAKNIQAYQKVLVSGEHPSALLRESLAGKQGDTLSFEEFLDALLNTKIPQIFAESSVCGDGSDWSQVELSILGDISFYVPCTIFDNAAHHNPRIHEQAFEGVLVYTPGALLRNGRGFTPVDSAEVVRNDQINQRAYDELYARRIGPVLRHINNMAESEERAAVVTIPGLGCGQFAGPFQGMLGSKLDHALRSLLQSMGNSLEWIKAIYYDPYNECENNYEHMNGVDYYVRPLTKGNAGKSQLSRPSDLDLSFANCKLYSVVAWDHVSWPGNDYYINSRATDDGVKAAATDSMKQLTGLAGHYDTSTTRYTPPNGYSSWWDVIRKESVRLSVASNVFIY